MSRTFNIWSRHVMFSSETSPHLLTSPWLTQQLQVSVRAAHHQFWGLAHFSVNDPGMGLNCSSIVQSCCNAAVIIATLWDSQTVKQAWLPLLDIQKRNKYSAHCFGVLLWICPFIKFQSSGVRHSFRDKARNGESHKGHICKKWYQSYSVWQTASLRGKHSQIVVCGNMAKLCNTTRTRNSLCN